MAEYRLLTIWERLVAIKGAARGDLEGIVRWHFSRQDAGGCRLFSAKA